MTKPFLPENNSRSELRKAQRERRRVRENKAAADYGIPKAFISHARRYGQSVYDIIQEGLRYNPEMRRRHRLLNP